VIIRYVAAAPTTTTSTTTSTTTTVSPNTTAVTSTTVVPAVSTSNSTATNVKAVGQSAIATIPSTIASSTTTTEVAPSPVAPSVPVGRAVARINGQEAEAKISREDNQFIISVSTITAKMWVVGADDVRRNLDNDGNIRILKGDSLHYELVGLAPNSDATLWLFSTPINLATGTANTQGVLTGSVEIPANVPTGDHRFVTEGFNADSDASVVAVGIAIGEATQKSNSARTLAISVLVLAILFALLVPSVLKRRKIRN
jgi:hypothetical protein